ncbi:MAG: hypothetical protein ACI4IK_02885 [Eubacterium sp.]
MIKLTFSINCQKLKRTDETEVVSDAIGQFEAAFTFDEWWDGYTPTAQFTKGGKTYDCLLVNNKCVIPHEVLEKGGVFNVSVFSTDGEGDRKTANDVSVSVKQSGYQKNGEHSEQPTPTVYEQILATIEDSKIVNSDGVVASRNADFAEVGEWGDGNPDNEDRTGYFVCFDVPTSGIVMRKANANDDAKGITVSSPAFAGNCTKDKFDDSGKLLPKYGYVCVIGLAAVHDNGECVVGGRCVPADNGYAAPSPNENGYQVVDRYSDDMILVSIEPNGDMLSRVQEKIKEMSVDQEYNPNSKKAQSGIAVAQAMQPIESQIQKVMFPKCEYSTFNIQTLSKTVECKIRVYNSEYAVSGEEIISRKPLWNCELPFETSIVNGEKIMNGNQFSYNPVFEFNIDGYFLNSNPQELVKTFYESGAVNCSYYVSFSTNNMTDKFQDYIEFTISASFADSSTAGEIWLEFKTLLRDNYAGVIVEFINTQIKVAEVVSYE